MLFEIENICKLEYLNSLNLNKILKKKRFHAWEGYLVHTTLSSLRKIFDKTITRLLTLEETGAYSKMLDELKDCVDAINSLNASNNHFLSSMDEAMIVDEFEEIIHASGLASEEDFHMDLIDQWKKW